MKRVLLLKEKTCCAAGHRNIPADKIEYVKQKLREEVNRAVADGYTCFLTDLSDGTNQLFAEAVRAVQKENDALRLEAVLPYRSHYEKLLSDAQAAPLLAACASVSYSGEKYASNCHHANRREQLKRSSLMIVVYAGYEKGRTASAIRMAYAQKIKTREIPLWA